MRKHIAILLSLFSVLAYAEYPINYEADIYGNFGSEGFAPHLISSNTDGVFSQAYGIQLRGKAWRNMDTSKRFSYGFGIDAITGYQSAVNYERYTGSEWYTASQHPNRVWLQQLYGEIKYRSVFLTAGMKQYHSKLLNNSLSSGDLVESGNARPIPQLRVGFVDFQNIPFTNGWAQIFGQVAFGKFTDSKWLENHYNYYNSHLTTGALYNYKVVYFRSMPAQPFSITVGMQAAAQFGGHYRSYSNGKLEKDENYPIKVMDLIKIMIPGASGANSNLGDQQYKYGNHVGSWDASARVRFRNSSELKLYTQWLWEDGSGIGKMNGFDGLWGLEYDTKRHSIVSNCVFEYIDFTNQSGPIHWAPNDTPNTSIISQATGADDYYNNYYYNGWTQYGMGLGSAFLKSPIYNTDGYLQYTDNRVRGLHAALSGYVSEQVKYRGMFSWSQSYGTPFFPNEKYKHNTSLLLEANYTSVVLKGWEMNVQVSFDSGTLYGDNFGAMIGIKKSGVLFDK